MMRRWTARIALGLLVILLLPAAALFAVISTEPGSRWLCARLPDVAPGELVIDEVQGTAIHRLEVKGVRYALPPYRLEADAVVLAWAPAALFAGRLHVRSLQARQLRATLPPAAEEERQEAGPPTEIRLPLAVEVDELLLTDARVRQGERVLLVERLAASAAVREDGVWVHGLDGAVATGTVVAEAEMPDESGLSDRSDLSFHAAGMGSLQPPYPFALALDWSAGVPAVKKLSGSGHFRGDLHNITLKHRLREPFPFTVSGSVDLSAGESAADLQGNWEGAVWPLSPEKANWLSPSGSFTLQGKMAEYSLELAARVSGADLPAAEFQLTARGDGQGLELAPLHLAAAGGAVTARGMVAWEPFPTWDLELGAEDMNPGAFLPEWPGRLALEGRTKGAVEEGAPALSVDLAHLEGELRGYPLKARGRAELAGGAWTIAGLEIVSGDNRINLEGTLAETVRLDLDLKARGLAALWPGLAGNLQGAARVSGKRDDPAVTATFSGAALRYQDVSIQGFDLDLRHDPAQPKASLANLDARDLAVQGERINRLTVEGSGGLERSAWQATLAADRAALSVSLTAGRKGEAWQGELGALDLDARAFGTWRLDAPAGFAYAPDAATLGRTCLALEATRLCVEGSRGRSGELDIRGSLQELPLNFAERFLPKIISIEGGLSGQFRAQGPPGRMSAHAELSPSAGAFTYRPPEGEPFRVVYDDARIQADYAGDRLSFALGLGIAQEGRIDGALALDPARSGGDRPMSGTIMATLPNLRLFSAFIPKAEDIQGALRVEAGLGGTLQEPRVTGRAEIRDAAARIPELGVELENILLTVENRGMDRLVLSGGIHSGAGMMNLSGEVQLSARAGWPLELTVTGKDFEILRRPEAQALLSPDVTLALARGAAEVRGELTIPEARVEVKELPKGTVTVSDDEIIVRQKEGAEESRSAEQAGLPITSQVTLRLGDKVSFRGFGLKTRLAGHLEVRTSPRRPPFAQGALELAEGRYKAYGQDLTIDQGRFLFNGPLDNPALEVRAVRHAGDVLAGLRIRGNAKAPRTEIFSEPAMSQNEALSYLLTGRPPGKGGASGAVLAQAALSMGLDRSEGTFQSVGKTLGLDTLGVEAGEDIKQTSFALGKYLTPELYVSYALGLFDREGAVQLRYRLTDSLSIKARSGKNQSMDLIYSIER